MQHFPGKRLFDGVEKAFGFTEISQAMNIVLCDMELSASTLDAFYHFPSYNKNAKLCLLFRGKVMHYLDRNVQGLKKVLFNLFAPGNFADNSLLKLVD